MPAISVSFTFYLWSYPNSQVNGYIINEAFNSRKVGCGSDGIWDSRCFKRTDCKLAHFGKESMS